MSSDPARLFSAHRLAAQMLARDAELAEQDQAIAGLVEAGTQLYGALSKVVDDQELWAWLREQATRPRLAEDERRLLELLSRGEAAGMLVVLGYEPPPPAQQLVDDALEAYISLGELQLGPLARYEQVNAAREVLAAFNERLLELLLDRGLIAPSVRRSRMRRMLRRGAEAALAIAPVVLSWGVAAEAQHLGVGPDEVKDLANLGGSVLATQVLGMLPDEHLAATAKASDILDRIDPETRVLALASVVEGRLRRLAQLGAEAPAGELVHAQAAFSRMRVAATVNFELADDTTHRLDVLSALLAHASLEEALQAWPSLRAELEAAAEATRRGRQVVYSERAAEEDAYKTRAASGESHAAPAEASRGERTAEAPPPTEHRRQGRERALGG